MIPNNVKSIVGYLFTTDKDVSVTMHCASGRVKKTNVAEEKIVSSVDELEFILEEVKDNAMYGSVALRPAGNGKVKMTIDRNEINNDTR